VRRATADDRPAVSAFVAGEFTDGWCAEAARAMDRELPTVFIALRGEAVVGFACHGVYRTDWFGPIGTAAAERGSGIGEALLRVCLDDLARAGVRRAQIAWVGPTAFYSRTVGARIGRQFVILEKHLDTEALAR
jgi:predicted N-acetyltransferase YhbS